YEQMDAAIEAHLQKFDHLPEKVDGRGHAIKPGDGARIAKAAKPKKRKSSDGAGENQPEQRTGPHRASGETNSGATGDSELTRSARPPSEANIQDAYLEGIAARLKVREPGEAAPIGAGVRKRKTPDATMSLTESDLLYEVGDFYVIRTAKGGFEVYRNGVTAAERVAQIGYKGENGLARAKAEADKRAWQVLAAEAAPIGAGD
ncbi:hypothetical protein, partial [Pseudomonas sp. RA_35y_Pfl2_P32]|uniref:hypothetical protein n=1 Tax=Pseudomonas sp. RA_35y_Pfl2_P32 TaxID=3088705 RepID=UPI0030DA227E